MNFFVLFYFQFISGEVRGVFCWIFCDFGDEFSVLDATGEEPKETFISNITKVIDMNNATDTVIVLCILIDRLTQGW